MKNILSTDVFLRISIKEKILFAQNLSIMTKSGVSLLDSLQLIQSQTKSKGFQRLLSKLMIDIENGQFLSASMEKYPRIFDEIFVNVIRIGESSGTLSENLIFIAQELEKKRSLAKKVKSALIYPTIVVFATIGVGWILTGYVLPKILPIFNEIDVELPATTKLLIKITDFVSEYNFYILIGFIILVVAVRLLLRLKPIRFMYHKSLIFIPIVRTFVINVNMAYFTRTLSILLKSGVKIVQALQITGLSLQNLSYRKELESISDSLREGGTIAAYLKKNEKFFPSTLSRLIEVGENTGNLDDNLKYLSEYYEKEVNDLTSNIASIIEPIILIAMGGMVGFIAISVITPLFKLSLGGI